MVPSPSMGSCGAAGSPFWGWHWPSTGAHRQAPQLLPACCSSQPGQVSRTAGFVHPRWAWLQSWEHDAAWLGEQQGSQPRGEAAVWPCKWGPGLVSACKVLLASLGEEPSPAATPRSGRAYTPAAGPIKELGHWPKAPFLAGPRRDLFWAGTRKLFIPLLKIGTFLEAGHRVHTAAPSWQGGRQEAPSRERVASASPCGARVPASPRASLLPPRWPSKQRDPHAQQDIGSRRPPAGSQGTAWGAPPSPLPSRGFGEGAR